MKKFLPPFTSEDPTVARFDHVKSIIGCTNDLEPIRAFMEEAIGQKCEVGRTSLLCIDCNNEQAPRD